LNRYWLTPAYEADFDAKVSDINGLCQQAPELAKQGQRFECVDETTGVQALERKHPDLPMSPGKVERREFKYIRHGTLAFMFNFDIVTGKLAACTARQTRNEQDFLEHIQGRVRLSGFCMCSADDYVRAVSRASKYSFRAFVNG
jgi:hypothetical protein